MDTVIVRRFHRHHPHLQNHFVKKTNKIDPVFESRSYIAQMIRINIYKHGLYRILASRRFPVPSNTHVSPPFRLLSNVNSFSKEEINNKVNIVNTAQEAFMDALIWNHCKNVIQVVQQPTYLSDYAYLLSQTVHPIIPIAKCW